MNRFLGSRCVRACGVLLSCLLLVACQHRAMRPDAAWAPPEVPEMTSPPARVGSGPASSAQKAPVGFMLAQEQQAEGLSALATANGTIWVLPQPVMTQADLGHVQARRWNQGQANQGKAFVRFSFSSAGARKLADVSSRYKGKILVVTVGRSIIGLVRLDAPVGNGVLNLPVASEQTAISIADAVGRTPN